MAVYEGVWYNHDSSKLVLTLSPAAAGFLSAAIVTFVNLVAAATWPALRYLIYIVRSQPGLPNDVFHHQRQVMLRNSNSPAGTAEQLLKMMFGWRSYKVRPVVRSIAYLVVCVAVFILWLLCGLYAPYIYTRTGSDVLLAPSPNCGSYITVATANGDDPEYYIKADVDNFNTVNVADVYVQQCYGDNNSSTSCSKYPAQALPFTMSNGTACPFGTDGSACITENSTTITFDTGYLDSNSMFGINAKSDDRIQYRRLTTCSPIETTAWTTITNTTGTPLEADFGPAILADYLYGPYGLENYTLQYNSLMVTLGTVPYSMFAVLGNWNSTDASSDWKINSTFYNAADADISIMFVENNAVEYPAPVLDPVFRAGLNPDDALFNVPYNNGTNFTIYLSSRSVAPIACKEQHQICLGPNNTNNCTPLQAYTTDLLTNTTQLPGFSSAHNYTAQRLWNAISLSSIQSVVDALDANALLASRTLSGVVQTAQLPEDQWVKEVVNWHSISLANMQAMVLEYATGPTDSYFNDYVDHPDSSGQKYACATQRVRDAQGYVNFDMAGLIILIVVGAALALFGLVFESLLGFVSKRRPAWKKNLEAWRADGMYHLHKSALEARGVEKWNDLDGNMPKSTETVDVRRAESPLLLPSYEQQYQQEFEQQGGSSEAVSLMHVQVGKA